MDFYFLVSYFVLAGLFIGFMITITVKWGVLEWLQAHAPTELIYKLLSCNFCMGFWLGSMFGLVMFFITRDIACLFGGCITAPLVKAIV